MQLNQHCQCLLDFSSIIPYLLVSLCLLNTTRQTLFLCIPLYVRIVYFCQGDLFYHVALAERAHSCMGIISTEKTNFTVCKLNENIVSTKSALNLPCEVTSFTIEK